jgi:hypothetical protein
MTGKPRPLDPATTKYTTNLRGDRASCRTVKGDVMKRFDQVEWGVNLREAGAYDVVVTWSTDFYTFLHSFCQELL